MNSLQINEQMVSGDVPQARFGHTMTYYGNNKAILFGGAVGDSGRFVITNECYQIDFTTNKWKKLKQQGKIPSQRAAHASCMIETNQILLYGGAASGGGGLSSSDLYLLDLKKNELEPTWMTVPTIGSDPGKRYGHTMVFFAPYLIVFGGNTGTQPVNDVWVLNVVQNPYMWQNIQPSGPSPPVRVYHSAALCQSGSANGMMVVFGGRTSDQSALNDCWGLRRHRDGSWDWCQAPYKKQSEADTPICRYQHWTTFHGPLMLVLGGRTVANADLHDNLEIFDTESSEWYKVKAMNRYRHAILLHQQNLFVYGGFEPDLPNKPLESMLKIDLTPIGNIHQKLSKYFQTNNTNNVEQNVLRERKFGQNITNQQPQIQNEKQQQQFSQQNNENSFTQYKKNSLENNQKPMHQQTFNNKSPLTFNNNNQNVNNENQRQITPIRSKKSLPQQKPFRLANEVIVAHTHENDEYINSGFQRVFVESLPEESKKLVQGQSQLDSQMPMKQNNFSSMFINSFLKPKEWKPNDLRMGLRRDLVHKLCDDVIQILKNEETLVRLRVPIKIFGSIYGRFNELLRMFDQYGSPCEDDVQNVEGDIEKFDYLFLGNYCDKGFNSIEVLILLFALKIKYPEQIHLLRGAHEDRRVNKIYGFAEECCIRFNEDIKDPNSLYQKFNKVFDYMPLAAVIEDQIFCVHGGIGNKMQSIYEIENIQRPIQNLWNVQNSLAMGLLWSSYTDKEIVFTGDVQKDIFKSNSIVKVGNLGMRKFLGENNLNMMITASSPSQEGFDTNAEGNIISVCSCPDIGGKFQNSGACIKITKNFQIVPNIINATSQKVGAWLTPETLLKTGIAFNSDEISLKKRSYTPPRVAGQ